MTIRQNKDSPKYWVRDNSWHNVLGSFNSREAAVLKSNMINHIHGGVLVSEIFNQDDKPNSFKAMDYSSYTPYNRTVH